MRRRSPNFFRSLERYAKLVQNFTIVFGIFGAAISLLIAQFDRRVTRTIELHNVYNDKVREDFLKMDHAWENYSRPIQAKQIDKASVLVFFESDERRRQLDNVVDFFEVLWVCINQGACDRNTALDLFGRPIDKIYETAAHYIAETREKDRAPRFGVGLERLYGSSRQFFLFRYI